MADVINLRQARKQKQRQDKDAKAAENRVIFGQSKAEKKERSLEKARADRDFDGKLRVVPLTPKDDA